MKSFIKIFLCTFFLILFISYFISAQTNVSGGIYANTSWTLANSPYIVVDTVVVFPNVTLTIEPGVTVKFENDKRLEIRQGKLIAIGTSVDSITFTSIYSPAVSGIWNSVFINGGNYISTFSYCNFYYAYMGINDCANQTHINRSNFVSNENGISSTSCGSGMIIDSCNFFNNTNGIFTGEGYISNCIFRLNQLGIYVQLYSQIINCIVNSNQTGISCNIGNNISKCIIDSNAVDGIFISEGNTSIVNCEIKYNGNGINTGNDLYSGNVFTKNRIENNSTGILLGYIASIYCNKICNNFTYDLQLTAPYNMAATYNDWCTTDSAFTTSVIYDGYDDISLGIVDFMPLDTNQCYLFGSNCAAHFNLYADTIPHNWIVVNQSTGYSPLSYHWTWGDGSIPDTNATPSHIYNTAGYYTICLIITDLTGCNSTYCDSSVYLYKSSSTSSMVTVNVISPTGIANPEITGNAFIVYPNPVNETLTIIKFKEGPAEFKLYDATGRNLISKEFTGTLMLNTEQLIKGLYYYEIMRKDGSYNNGKVIKN